MGNQENNEEVHVHFGPVLSSSSLSPRLAFSSPCQRSSAGEGGRGGGRIPSDRCQVHGLRDR